MYLRVFLIGLMLVTAGCATRAPVAAAPAGVSASLQGDAARPTGIMPSETASVAAMAIVLNMRMAMISIRKGWQNGRGEGSDARKVP